MAEEFTMQQTSPCEDWQWQETHPLPIDIQWFSTSQVLPILTKCWDCKPMDNQSHHWPATDGIHYIILQYNQSDLWAWTNPSCYFNMAMYYHTRHLGSLQTHHSNQPLCSQSPVKRELRNRSSMQIFFFFHNSNLWWIILSPHKLWTDQWQRESNTNLETAGVSVLEWHFQGQGFHATTLNAIILTAVMNNTLQVNEATHPALSYHNKML